VVGQPDARVSCVSVGIDQKRRSTVTGVAWSVPLKISRLVALVFDQEVVVQIPDVDFSTKKLNIGDVLVLAGNHTNRYSGSLFLFALATISDKEDLPTGFLQNGKRVLFRTQLLVATNGTEKTKITVSTLVMGYFRKLTVAAPRDPSGNGTSGVHVANGTGGLIQYPYNLDGDPTVLFAPKTKVGYRGRHSVEDDVIDVCLLHYKPFVLATEPHYSDGTDFLLLAPYRFIPIVAGDSDQSREREQYLQGFSRREFLQE